jgi:Flp pilus assembly protein TadG
MADVVLAAWTRCRPTGAARDECGATALEWVMIVALLLSAVVLVTAFGTSWTGDVA